MEITVQILESQLNNTEHGLYIKELQQINKLNTEIIDKGQQQIKRLTYENGLLSKKIQSLNQDMKKSKSTNLELKSSLENIIKQNYDLKS